MRNVVPNNGKKVRSFWTESENIKRIKTLNPLANLGLSGQIKHCTSFCFWEIKKETQKEKV